MSIYRDTIQKWFGFFVPDPDRRLIACYQEAPGDWLVDFAPAVVCALPERARA
jgi:hypothetical protein